MRARGSSRGGEQPSLCLDLASYGVSTSNCELRREAGAVELTRGREDVELRRRRARGAQRAGVAAVCRCDRRVLRAARVDGSERAAILKVERDDADEDEALRRDVRLAHSRDVAR